MCEIRYKSEKNKITFSGISEFALIQRKAYKIAVTLQWLTPRKLWKRFAEEVSPGIPLFFYITVLCDVIGYPVPNVTYAVVGENGTAA